MVFSLFSMVEPGVSPHFPWFSMVKPTIFPGWMGNPQFSMVKPIIFPWSTPPFFERWSPRTARRSAERPGVTSMPWRRSFQKRREGMRPKRRRRRWENVGFFSMVFLSVFPMKNRGFPGFFYRFLPWKIEVQAMEKPWKLGFWGWKIGFNGFAKTK